MTYRTARIALAAASLTGLAQAAPAQTVGSLTATGGNALFTFSGLTFTVSNCYGSGISCSTVEMVAVASPKGVEVDFLGNGGPYGSDILSRTNSSTQPKLNFTLTVASAGTARIASVSSAVYGSVTGSGGIGAGLNLLGVTGCVTQGGYINGTACYSGPTFGNASLTTFSPVASLSIDYQLQLFGSPSGTVVFSKTASTFATVPEPGSIALLAVALGGVGIARLRRKGRARER